MKKLLLAATFAVALLAAPRFAAAGVDVSIGIGLPFPGFAVVAPPPVVYGPPVVYSAPVYAPAYYGPRYGRAYYPGRRWGWHKHRHYRGCRH